MNVLRFGRSGEMALSGTPERAASRTADAVLSRGADVSFFLTDIFSIVTDSQLALDGNYDRVAVSVTLAERAITSNLLQHAATLLG